MEKKTYRITFMADLTEDDVRAMNKCFYDAMQEAMEIGPCWELQLEEIKNEPEPEATDLPAWNFKKYEPSLEELLMMPMRHIQNVKDCLEACTSKADVFKVMKLVPSMFGHFDVNFDDEYEGFTVVNTYTNEEGYQEDRYWFDYPEDWDHNSEDEEDEE